jgi:alanine-glyoxylate transaminase/serine-glyoxylate transaminase/serine-pyruvate transaminase
MSSQNPVFIPGPTNIPEGIRRACDIPTLDHRSARFKDILLPALANVKQVLKTQSGEVVIFPGSGTGGWEAALSNTLSPGDTVLAADVGMFSRKWVAMSRRLGLSVIEIKRPWGEGLPVEAFAQALADDKTHTIKAVLATHNETATGVRSDLAGLRKAMDTVNHPALLLVDGVSSIASMDFRMDEWGVDVAVTGSQKGFMLPAGLAIVGISQKALAAMKQAKQPRFYFDFQDMLTLNPQAGYPYTPSVGLLSGLLTSSTMLLDEGLEQVFARHHRMAEAVRAAASAWGLGLSAVSPDLYSDTVTAIMVPQGIDGNALVSHADEAYGVSFGAGLGDVAGKLFRIGHLGMLTEAQALAGLAVAEMALVDMGADIALGSGVAAAQRLFRAPKSQPQLQAA